MEKKEENKYFKLGNIIRYVMNGSVENRATLKFGDVYFIIYKNKQGTLPINEIFDNLIHYHKRMYQCDDKQLILDYLENLKTEFTEEELKLYPDYTAKDGKKHLSQKDDEMFMRGILSPL